MFSTPLILSFSILLTLPIIFFLLGPTLNPHPLAPIPASDELDDLRLFHRATAPPSVPSHLSFSSSSKIAFLFLTNTDLHFLPLWNRFFRHAKTPLYNIYVHADPTVNVTRPSPDTVFGHRFIANAKRTFRASATLISATRRLLATAILDDPANDYFAIVSQYCIPLHSFNYIHRSLFTSRNFDLASESDPDSSGLTRYGVLKHKSYIEILSKEPRLWKRYTARGRFVMMPEVPFEEFRAGSQFFVLNRKDALLVLKDKTLWRKFKLPCFRAEECYPEEHYFPTLLSMQDPNGVTGYTLTRVNWTGTVAGHPHMYTPEEVTPGLIYELRESNYSTSYLFARKFSPDCLGSLMRIADSVIFRD